MTCSTPLISCTGIVQCIQCFGVGDEFARVGVSAEGSICHCCFGLVKGLLLLLPQINGSSFLVTYMIGAMISAWMGMLILINLMVPRKHRIFSMSWGPTIFRIASTHFQIGWKHHLNVDLLKFDKNLQHTQSFFHKINTATEGFSSYSGSRYIHISCQLHATARKYCETQILRKNAGSTRWSQKY